MQLHYLVKDISVVRAGSTFPEKYQGNLQEKYPFYKVSDMNLEGNEIFMNHVRNSISEEIKVEIRAKPFPKNTIIFPKVGGAILTNKKRILSKTSCLDNNIMGLTPNEDLVYFNYLYYFFQMLDLYNLSNKSNPPSIRQETVENIPIILPDLKSQKRIVAILDEAFAGINQAIANTEKNLANTRELFESYLNEIFLKQSSEWTLMTLKGVSKEFGRGKSKHRPRNDPALFNGQYPFIQTGDVRNTGHIISTYFQTYNEVGLKQSKLWPKGTICITIAANIAETAILGFDACFPDSIIGLVVDETKATNSFVEYLLQAMKLRIKAKSQGSAQDNINLATFEQEYFPFPNLAKQKEIVEKLDSLSKDTNNLELVYQQKLQSLTELKQSLLQKAFTGELTANNVDKLVNP